MSLKPARRVLSTAACGVVAGSLALTAGAMASGSSLSLEVKGEYAKVHRTACHKSKSSWRAFRRGSTLEFRGYQLPAPTRHFSVRIKLEKCVRGSWRQVHDYFLVGESTADRHPGRFKAFYPARPYAPRARHHHLSVAYYRAKAYVGTSTSSEQYFFVTSS